MYNEGVYIPFPSCALKLSNLELNSYLPALTILNDDYLPKDESLKAQGPLQYAKCTFINGSFKICATISKAFSKFMLACPAVLRFHAGSLDELAMLLHHTPRLENFHGLLSMSSCTVCPCFCITASVSQLTSSTG
jgi:hypothetical protein